MESLNDGQGTNYKLLLISQLKMLMWTSNIIINTLG